MIKIFLQKKTRDKIFIFIFLFLIFCFAFFIRTYFYYEVVFSDGIVKYTEDAMYHMRYLENMLLGGHFPSFMYFDPYSAFPHGTYNKIAPLYDFILALIIWLVSFGKPTIEIVNKIEEGKLKFTGLGNTLTKAKTLAGLSDQEVLLSKELHEKTISEIKTSQQTVQGIEVFKVKQIADVEKNQQFIKEFMTRINEEGKERKK